MRALLVSSLLCASCSAFAVGESADSTGNSMLLAEVAFPGRTGGELTGLPGTPDRSGTSLWSQQELLGRWGDFRTGLDDAGIRFLGTYKGDNLDNLAGGTERRFVYIDNLDLNLTIDGERVFGMSGTTIFAQVFHNNGGSFSSCVGDAQVVSNIEAADFTKLYQLWMQQEFLDGRLSVLIGLYDVSSDFYVTPSSGTFLNSTFGTGKELAQTGSNGPSIFPNTALAARMRASLGGNFVVQAAVIDATPGSDKDLYETSFVVNSRDGALVVAEAAYVEDAGSSREQAYVKIGLGVWSYTRDVQAVFASGYSEQSGIFNANHGVYVIAERQISQSLSVFVRGGVAPEDMNQFQRNFSAGMSITGIVAGRDDDQFGVGLAYAENGRAFRDAMANAGIMTDAAELTLESTYRASVTPWLILQPDIQYVINPGTDPSLDNALIAGFRIEVHL
jgi:porin